MKLLPCTLALALAVWLGAAAPSANACPFCQAAAAGLAAKESGCCADCFEPTCTFGATAGLDYANAYYHRGYRVQDSGFLVQPFVTPFFRWEPAPGVTIEPYLTIWDSTSLPKQEQQLATATAVANTGHFHSPVAVQPTSSGAPAVPQQPRNVLKLMGGTYLTAGDLSADFKYTWYNASPFAEFAPIQEVGVKVAYDVLGAWRDPERSTNFGLKPYGAIYYETLNSATQQGTYVETGLEPFVHCSVCGRKVGISVPVYVGLSADNYFVNAAGANEPFGYVSGGVALSMPIFPGAKFGAWFCTVSAQYLYLSAESLRIANGGDPNAFIGKVGIGFSY